MASVMHAGELVYLMSHVTFRKTADIQIAHSYDSYDVKLLNIENVSLKPFTYSSISCQEHESFLLHSIKEWN